MAFCWKISRELNQKRQKAHDRFRSKSERSIVVVERSHGETGGGRIPSVPLPVAAAADDLLKLATGQTTTKSTRVIGVPCQRSEPCVWTRRSPPSLALCVAAGWPKSGCSGVRALPINTGVVWLSGSLQSTLSPSTDLCTQVVILES